MERQDHIDSILLERHKKNTFLMVRHLILKQVKAEMQARRDAARRSCKLSKHLAVQIVALKILRTLAAALHANRERMVRHYRRLLAKGRLSTRYRRLLKARDSLLPASLGSGESLTIDQKNLVKYAIPSFRLMFRVLDKSRDNHVGCKQTVLWLLVMMKWRWQLKLKIKRTCDTISNF